MLLACVFALGVACKKPPAPTTVTHTVGLWLNGERRGSEEAVSTIDGQDGAIRTTTVFNDPPIRLDGQLIVVRGRATSLLVTGDAPPSLNALVDVTTTADRTDRFPIRAPLPVHVLGALVRRSMLASRRQFATLPGGSVTIDACRGPEGPFTDATCHAVTGLASGRALVWIDRRGQMAAAVARTPWGALLATPADRDAAHPALVKRFDVYSAP